MEERPFCRRLFWLQGGDGYGQTNSHETEAHALYGRADETGL